MSASRARDRGPITVGARTDVGCVRAQNEDSMLVQLPLLVVADGIGGQEAGEVASQIAIDTMSKTAPEFADAKQLGTAVEAANRAVMEGVDMGKGRPGMGATMTAAIIEGDRMVIAQVGDSRAYRLRNGKLEQLTHDHSLIAAMVENGQLTEEEARTHPSRSIITRALGSDPDMRPDLFEFDVKKGDKILLCSDGLSSMISHSQIEDILVETPNPQRAADKLVQAAKQAGGLDNITVIVANISEAKPVMSQQAKRSRRFSVLLFTIIAVLLIACAIGGFALYVRNSAFLINENGYVAVYSGRLDTIAGMEFKWYDYTSDVEVDKLQSNVAESLNDGIQFDSLDAAEDTLQDYKIQIQEDEAMAAQRKANASNTSTTTDTSSSTSSTSTSSGSTSSSSTSESSQSGSGNN
ncbi:MAG: Stp1/IreP family PP2C-type Ser/Thr phosphatase [Coriobacteriales bacterium]|jgi:serine/threonine protein phosphatase PrpC